MASVPPIRVPVVVGDVTFDISPEVQIRMAALAGAASLKPGSPRMLFLHAEACEHYLLTGHTHHAGRGCTDG